MFLKKRFSKIPQITRQMIKSSFIYKILHHMNYFREPGYAVRGDNIFKLAELSVGACDRWSVLRQEHLFHRTDLNWSRPKFLVLETWDCYSTVTWINRPQQNINNSVFFSFFMRNWIFAWLLFPRNAYLLINIPFKLESISLRVPHSQPHSVTHSMCYPWNEATWFRIYSRTKVS